MLASNGNAGETSELVGQSSNARSEAERRLENRIKDSISNIALIQRCPILRTKQQSCFSSTNRLPGGGVPRRDQHRCVGLRSSF